MNGVKKLALRASAFAAILLLSAAPSIDLRDARDAAPVMAIEPRIHATLAEMSTGDNQGLVVKGTDAQSRNALIPVVGGLRPGLSAYSPIAQSSSHYSTALRCLTQAIYYEAANESEAGKRAVAQVVLNRMRHPAYPNSVCGVVYQGSNARVCQFSFTCDGALLRRPMARQWQESLRVAERALAGEQFGRVGTATHYHADYVVPKWAYTLEKLEVIGTHIFYRFPGSGGKALAFQSRWSKHEAIPSIDWDRLTRASELATLPAAAETESFVPGLTVVADPKDRHASNDVGGRLDTTKQWRLTIPDPVASQQRYEQAINGQAEVSRKSGGSTGQNMAEGSTE